MHQQLSKNERTQAVVLCDQNHKYKKIEEIFKISVSTVSRTHKNYISYNTLSHKCGNGRPKKAFTPIISVLTSENNKNSKISLRKLKHIVKENCGMDINHTTVKKYLNDLNLFAFSYQKNPFLKPQHILARYQISED